MVSIELSKYSGLLSKTDLVIPDNEILEQSSNTLAAAFCATLVKDEDILADLTAGLGINTYFYSQKVEKVYAVEKSKSRADALVSNLRTWGCDNVKIICDDSLTWLKEAPTNITVVFVDPSRRRGLRKLVKLQDCSPDIFQIIPILNKDVRILVKSSPLLDITSIVNQVENLSGVYILEVKGEVKELLLDIHTSQHNPEGRQFIKCCRLSLTGTEELEFNIGDIGDSNGISYLYSEKDLAEGYYIYEPSSSLMKASCWGAFAKRYDKMYKFAKDSHLFYSEKKHLDFPGRIFQMRKIIHSSDLKKMKGGKVNIISRNHPAKASEIERRYNFVPDGKDYIIATQTLSGKVMLLAERI